jgi:non-homologous end joining protein Ku
VRPIWKGALTFGLVNIPVGLSSATTRSDLSFRLLHAKDQAPKAYARLREALRRSGRLGVAAVVLRQREHLAAVQAAGEALTLTTMRFAHEIVPPSGLALPGTLASTATRSSSRDSSGRGAAAAGRREAGSRRPPPRRRAS